jgi:hypothetical protein
VVVNSPHRHREPRASAESSGDKIRWAISVFPVPLE